MRRLARHHKVFLSDVTKLNDNLERAKTEARHALEAKKRMLQQALDRRCGSAARRDATGGKSTRTHRHLHARMQIRGGHGGGR